MSSTLTLYFYLIVSWFLAIFLHNKKSITQNTGTLNLYKLIFFTVPPLIVGFFFAALRPFNAGGDTISYISAFSRISSPFTAAENASYGTELLFWPTQAVIKFFFDARGWLVANYLIVAFLAFFAYRKITQNTKISPLLFSLVFMTFFAVYTGNAMRQVYSIPLGLIAFHYCYNKDHLKFLIFSALAIFFHWSAAIVLFSPVFTRIPNNIKFYIGIPIAALVCSSLIEQVTDLVISLSGFDWLIAKANLYFKGGRVSHIEAAWKTMNFWLCIAIYLSLIITKAVTTKAYQETTKYSLMFISLMLFSVNNPDVSERYMVWFVFIIPISVAIILSRFKIAIPVNNAIYAILFSLMAVLVFTRASAMETLGIA
ncbi:EpsG family protein [Pseudomonas cavernae]|uniref:EpsG family protein n=1 Tax=Pseudomonas cavernae TaxID=2320867 RepID=A0A385YYI3_9PSED|nr:EpsG family protein [Pseudomonas cavernae]AYC31461.1 EpsG family protein [Pseudomonas cavernae]